MTYVLDVGGGSYPRGRVVLDVRLPSCRLEADYVIGDAFYLPFRSNSFSVVVCYGAINHFPSDNRFLKEVRHVLKNRGILLLSGYTYFGFAISLLHLLKNNPFGALRLTLNSLRRRYRWYRLERLENKVKREGFKILAAYPNVTFPWRPTKTPHNLLITAYRIHNNEQIV